MIRRAQPMTTIADHAVAMMTEARVSRVMWGDGLLTDIGARASVKAKHPLGKMNAVLAGLARDPRFEPFQTLGHDRSGRPRNVRGFRLKETTT